MEEKKYEFKTLKIEDMIQYLKENAPDEIAWFLTEAYHERTTKKGKKITVYNHLKAKRAFCEKFMPDIVPPKREPKERATKILEEWLNDTEIKEKMQEIIADKEKQEA